LITIINIIIDHHHHHHNRHSSPSSSSSFITITITCAAHSTCSIVGVSTRTYDGRVTHAPRQLIGHAYSPDIHV